MSSAAKMVADSTQSDLPETKVTTKKRKKETLKKKVKKKKTTLKKGKKKASEDEFEEHDLDLDNEVKPLGHFVKDREALVRQLFHCVRGTSLKRALPDVLKELELEDLQRRCLEQLEVMSKKRIRRIIAGDDPATISSSGTEDETSEEEEEEEPELDTRDLDDDADDGYGMEAEGYEGYDDDNDEMVDSTSQYAGELEDSDREFDEHEEGSLGHSSPSPVPSDYLMEEGDTMEQEESVYSDAYQENIAEDYTEDSQSNVGDIPLPPTVESDHETEEGEVTDSEHDKPETAEPETAEPETADRDTTGTETAGTETADTGTAETDLANTAETTKEEDSKGPEKEDSENSNDKKSSEDDTGEKDVVGDKEGNKVEGDKNTDKGEGENDGEKTEGTEKSRQEISAGEKKDSEGNTDNVDKVESKEGQQESVKADNKEEREEEEGRVESDEEREEVAAASSNRTVLPPSSESLAPVLTQNQMELLELEMRARAIRAMLKTAK